MSGKEVWKRISVYVILKHMGVKYLTKDTYKDIMCGERDNSIRFTDIRKLLESLGFTYRVKGDHFIYWREDITEIINIQPDGNKAKPYQIKQIRILFHKYGI